MFYPHYNKNWIINITIGVTKTLLLTIYLQKWIFSHYHKDFLLEERPESFQSMNYSKTNICSAFQQSRRQFT